jgi:IclR family acetate operon transcriptional repressor
VTVRPDVHQGSERDADCVVSAPTTSTEIAAPAGPDCDIPRLDEPVGRRSGGGAATSDREGVVARTAAILRVLHRSRGNLTLGQLAARTGLPKSTVHRLVVAMTEEGLATKSGPRGGISLGPELTSPWLCMPALAGAVHPELEALSQQVAETVDLSVLHGGRAVLLSQIAAPRADRVTLPAGSVQPLVGTATGEALLAVLESERAEWFMDQRGTEPSACAAARQRVQEIRQRRIAVMTDDPNEGILSVAVATQWTPQIVLAISIRVPMIRAADVRPDHTKLLHRGRAAAGALRRRAQAGAPLIPAPAGMRRAGCGQSSWRTRSSTAGVHSWVRRSS